jgi:uncharacterized protein (TIGR00255 family)
MLQSMTGFASKAITIPLDSEGQATITLSLKALNSRFFEATCKLPYALSHLETDLIQLLKSKLKRGHIFFSINVSSPQLFKGNVEPAITIVESYLKAIQTIQKKYTVPGVVDISDLIQLPNIFAVEEKTFDETIRERIMQATQEVIILVTEARKKEGAALLQDMIKLCAVIESEMIEIEKVSEALMAKKKQEVGEQLRELGTSQDQVTETQRASLYYELNKIDIHEEIVRFKTHLINFKNVLQSAAPDIEHGKRLDFTLQELAREINTIAAKCSDARISSLAINIKVGLEKLREQAQNIV